MPPRSRRHRRRRRCRSHAIGRNDADSSARPVDRQNDNRRTRKVPVGVLLSARDDAARIPPARTLDLDGRAFGDQSPLILDGLQPALHEVRTEVVEQQQPAQEEKHHDEDRRDKAHEDVREDQLASDTPQQPPLGQHEQQKDEVQCAGGDRESSDGVDDAQKRRDGTGCHVEDADQQLDRETDDNRAARQRPEECLCHPLLSTREGRGQQRVRRTTEAREALEVKSCHVRGLEMLTDVT